LESAANELEEITPELRAHPDVLLVRCDIYGKAKKWDAVVTIAETLVKMTPGKHEGWVHRSFALHELGRTQEAFDKLLPVGGKFKKVWLVPYNLACYCSRLGRLDDAQLWLKKALLIDGEAVPKAAIDDPDLKPLWDSMSGTLWKKE
jgi:tetratricopeptide (TPR) repeat protein